MTYRLMPQRAHDGRARCPSSVDLGRHFLTTSLTAQSSSLHGVLWCRGQVGSISRDVGPYDER